MRAAVFRPILRRGLLLGVAGAMPVLFSLESRPQLSTPVSAPALATLRDGAKVEEVAVATPVPPQSGWIILRRVAARLVDLVLVGLGTSVVWIVTSSSIAGACVGMALDLLRDVAPFGFRSPGKALAGLTVVDAETGRAEDVHWTRRVARNGLSPLAWSLLGIMIGMPVVVLISPFGLALAMGSAAFVVGTEKRQTAIDKMVGVAVTRS